MRTEMTLDIGSEMNFLKETYNMCNTDMSILLTFKWVWYSQRWNEFICSLYRQVLKTQMNSDQI